MPGVPVRVITARRVDDPRQVITIGQVGLPIERLDDALAAVAAQERRREQLDDVIESTQRRRVPLAAPLWRRRRRAGALALGLRDR